MEDLAPQFLKILQIIWINIILSGDNAVVIALACRGLPENRRRTGMLLGAGVAVGLRIVFTLIVASLLSTPFLKIAGSLLLLWIAVKLLVEDEEDAEGKIAETDRLWHAIRTIAIADAVMSLDNVLAIAAVAKDSTTLLMLGLAISIPLIIAGAALIMALLARFPILVWAGAALLGWVAGDMLISDPWLVGRLGEALVHKLELPVAAVCAVLVVGLGYLLNRRAAGGEALQHKL
jgi:YjbE family integral membrane protein